MNDETAILADRFLRACARRGLRAATAESCTGGLIVAAMTEIAGSSAVVDRGFVTYSNEAKMDLLGVAATTLAAHGAVSPETAREMAAGALQRSAADIALSVTGIAGPGGGSAAKPVGLVWFGVAVTGQAVRVERRDFGELGRAQIRNAAVRTALLLGLDALGNDQPDTP